MEPLCNLVGGWEKRHYSAMVEHLKPTNLDTDRLSQLIASHEYSALKKSLDDYAALEVTSEQELIDLFARNFYFGCEADDPTTAWAFDARMPARLKAMLGTDVGHWDVTDFADVLPEVWEMVEDGLLSETDLRDLTFRNPLELHTRMNPDFFKSTSIEGAVARELSDPVA